MAAFELNVNLITALAEAKDPRLSYLWTAVSIAQQAGAMIKDAFEKSKEIKTKACSTDLVTETDQKVEDFIKKSINEQYPDHCFIGEETVSGGEKCVLTDRPTWIVDPVDGTTNFVHRFPFVAVSIAIAINKEIEIAVIYGCILEKLYIAVKGQGSYCGQEKISVSQRTDLSDALILTEWGSNRDPDRLNTIGSNIIKVAGRPSGPAHGVRSVGSAALNMALIASGCADVYYEWGIHCWDMAAGKLIIEEAGGVVLSTSGESFDLLGCNVLCGSSGVLLSQVSEQLTQISVERD
ncbi:inositol monophosphatase 1-like [Rhopilema esculentum]|uniref:inositol monophosphatase 1-like n=1 Tax=Rhopilema esculentum TaxID=499914 RepID=UPI0031DA9874|eukprot:gene1391-15802_t